MKCTKAIIAVAGYGTRRLPITKAIEKCMLPVGDRPIVDYIVDDCVAAGITDIIFVVSEMSSQIRTYYGHNQQIEDYLVRQHNTDLLDQISQLSVKARFHFVTQDQHQRYGTSVPIWLARDYIDADETFMFMNGDSILYRPGGSAIADFLAAARASHMPSAMVVVPVSPEKVDQYGIVSIKKQGEVTLFERVVEKPTIQTAPSNLINIGCFVLNPTIFPFVERSMQTKGKEQHFTDALNWYREAGNQIAAIKSNAEFLDCGNLEGWLATNNRIIGTGKGKR